MARQERGKRRPWQQHELRLRDNHAWRAKPGYQIFVADRGAVRFDIPAGWVIRPDVPTISFHDKEPPDDDAKLQMTRFHLPPGFDWDVLPAAKLLEDVMAGPGPDELGRTPIRTEPRQDIALVWRETRFVDKTTGREALSRTAFARGAAVAVLLTLDFWASDLARIDPIWRELLDSLRLEDYVDDPAVGPIRH